MTRWIDIGSLRPLNREAKRMIHSTSCHFIISSKSWKNWQSSRISRSPSRRSDSIRFEIKLHPGISIPKSILRESTIELIEHTTLLLNRDNMTIPITTRTSFDRGSKRNRKWSKITLITISRIINRNHWLTLICNNKRNSIRSSTSKISMKMSGRSNTIDKISRIRMNRKG